MAQKVRVVLLKRLSDSHAGSFSSGHQVLLRFQRHDLKDEMERDLESMQVVVLSLSHRVV